ncbi:uncharacterized protein BT62DRAFT_923129 [Guyanagaster necrorhizus]|uniref:Uncharacterized protein n=1 Tax=Guyanagaster necrorhizus TaxID=856835 RepID=A0A9P8AND3_9AGAR|nr:uncharacterized protein BT62DRAFT_923129 [Guyanagaster necrorhizus MCA 3950]KAG7441709.1 hypothetical protein BT62DRAFT_923129 [Guyanagaster necrorhizus MCA 3950]
MYHLAAKVWLVPQFVKNVALENIRSQLTPSNIVAEVFSKFYWPIFALTMMIVFRYPEILDREVKYLVDNFRGTAGYILNGKHVSVSILNLVFSEALVNSSKEVVVRLREIGFRSDPRYRFIDQQYEHMAPTRDILVKMWPRIPSKLVNHVQELPDAYVHTLMQLMTQCSLERRASLFQVSYPSYFPV